MYYQRNSLFLFFPQAVFTFFSVMAAAQQIHVYHPKSPAKRKKRNPDSSRSLSGSLELTLLYLARDKAGPHEADYSTRLELERSVCLLDKKNFVFF